MAAKVGDKVKIYTMWADKEFPNVEGRITGFRHGGNVVVIETTEGRSPRFLHTQYFSVAQTRL
jgi:hypothetical protein